MYCLSALNTENINKMPNYKIASSPSSYRSGLQIYTHLIFLLLVQLTIGTRYIVCSGNINIHIFFLTLRFMIEIFPLEIDGTIGSRTKLFNYSFGVM